MASNILMNVINVFHEGFHFEKNHVEKVIRVENHFRRGMDFFFLSHLMERTSWKCNGSKITQFVGIAGVVDNRLIYYKEKAKNFSVG